ncbi:MULTISPECIES: RidA family protein [Kitasatospora]|uniref:Enamine deaminase RidA (YjgF/YER057c/UK114 family) n=2 Tax=Kitasatospora TaxID=2063 RepID=A0ABT1J6H8_9ACTN|nr:RidA family protein [Kitasatospora paracochleata]MCP2312661.1 enamine deaminase RidA (YjgF/YER057c/UK114 family) [Kitasatospora paracochleata]
MTEPSATARVSGFSPWEDEYGFSRAVAAGDFVLVAGCTAYDNGMVQHEGDPYEQAVAAFGVAAKALAHYGLTEADVVRTRMYITHVRDSDEIGRAHKQVFDTVRPVTTLVVVEGLVDSRMMVEVEVEAYRPGLASMLESRTSEGSKQP